MADQHANSANLLIFSNGVQLIPLAAFISRSHTEGREGRRENRGGFVLTLYSSSSTLSTFISLSEQRNQTPVINEVDTRASGSCCGDGGGSDGGWDKKK